MGYDLHITRVDDWAESETRPIELEEWLAYAEASPDLTRDGSYGAGDERGFFNLRIGGIDTWLAWSDGVIYSKNPPAAVRAKMK